MVSMIPIASGKGGVGKTVLAANLGVALAQRGRTVVLVDLDLGAANLHTCLGVKSSAPGLGALAWRQAGSLLELVIETEVPRLHFVPGDNLLPGAANLDYAAKRKILRGLSSLPADFVLLDLGAGSSYNVVDFFLAASRGILVAQPETTSVLNAYSFLKTSVFRLLFRAFPKGSPERVRLAEFASRRIEGGGSTFMDLASALAAEFPERAPGALAELRRLTPRILLNMGRGPDDAVLGARLRDISARNLGLGVEYLGYLLADEAVRASIAERTPLILTRPNAPFARGVDAVASRLVSEAPSAPPNLALDDEELYALIEEALGMERA